MKRSQLIDALAARFESNRNAAAEALDAVVDTITREVAKGEQVVIKGFGTFERVLPKGAAKKGKKASKKSFVPAFEPGKDLVGAVTGKLPLPKVPSLPKKPPTAPVPEVPADVAPVEKPPVEAATAKTAPATKTAAKRTSTGKKTTAAKRTAATRTTPTAKKATSTAKKATSTAKRTTAKKTAAPPTPSTPEQAQPDPETPSTGS